MRQPEQQPDGQALIEFDMQILRHRPRRIETQPFSLSTFQPLMKRVYSRIENTGGRFAKKQHERQHKQRYKRKRRKHHKRVFPNQSKNNNSQKDHPPLSSGGTQKRHYKAGSRTQLYTTHKITLTND